MVTNCQIPFFEPNIFTSPGHLPKVILRAFTIQCDAKEDLVLCYLPMRPLSLFAVFCNSKIFLIETLRKKYGCHPNRQNRASSFVCVPLFSLFALHKKRKDAKETAKFIRRRLLAALNAKRSMYSRRAAQAHLNG